MIKNMLRQRGQSLVEFALTITLIFFMFSATIDFGLAFFAFQGISGAAQEGVQYSVLKPTLGLNNNGTFILNDEEIRARVMNEAGTVGSTYANQARFVNLRDLNNNGNENETDDQDLIIITSTPLPIALPSSDCANKRSTQFCQMNVTVTYDYKPMFVGANLFGASVVPLQVTRSMIITR